MKFSRKTAKQMTEGFNVDLTKVSTVKELIEATRHCTYKVVMEADLCDETVHYIETPSGDIIVFITDEVDSNKIVEVHIE